MYFAMIYKHQSFTATRRPLTETERDDRDGRKCKVTAGCREHDSNHMNEASADHTGTGRNTNHDVTYTHGGQEAEDGKRKEQWILLIIRLVQQKERCRAMTTYEE